MNCFKIILKNIAVTLAGAAIIIALVIGIFGASLLTAAALGLLDGPGPTGAFSVLYMLLGFGIAEGIDECRKRRRS